MKRRKQAANEALGVLAEWFPNAFFLYERKRKPLKVGIQDDLITATAGAITVREIRDALCRYTGNVHYLRGVAAGGERIDLDGKPAGQVTPSEAEHARVRWAAAAKPVAVAAIPNPIAPAAIPKPIPKPMPRRATPRVESRIRAW